MKIEVIKRQEIQKESAKTDGRIRVAAYCRVSTDSADQAKSYDSMVRYYTDLINNNPEWVPVGVYADKAITGTLVDNRIQFQKLINDCMKGKIDKIITKSIPRFARNTVDTLNYIRTLRDLNIGVYFESEKIDTIRDGEFVLTILSSLAQQEVENTSAYVRKGQKMMMQRGEMVGFSGCYGYHYDAKTKSLYYVEEEAEVVKYIFKRYLDGLGCTLIARELNQRGIKTYRGHEWVSDTVLHILKNEKYTGDLLLGKNYTTDPITKRRLSNKGEKEMYLIKDHHKAIVSREDFEKVQSILAKRSINTRKVMIGDRQPREALYVMSEKIRCGYCGRNYTRRTWNQNALYKRIVWQCTVNVRKGKIHCPDSKAVTEELIESAFVEAHNKMFGDDAKVLTDFETRLIEHIQQRGTEEKQRNLTNSYKNLKKKEKLLYNRYVEGKLSNEQYESKNLQIQNEIDAVLSEMEKVARQLEVEKLYKDEIHQFILLNKSRNQLESFDGDAFETLISEVIVGGYDQDGTKDPYSVIFVVRHPILKQAMATEEVANSYQLHRVIKRDSYQLHCNDTRRDGMSFVQTFWIEEYDRCEGRYG